MRKYNEQLHLVLYCLAEGITNENDKEDIIKEIDKLLELKEASEK